MSKEILQKTNEDWIDYRTSIAVKIEEEFGIKNHVFTKKENQILLRWFAYDSESTWMAWEALIIYWCKQHLTK